MLDGLSGSRLRAKALGWLLTHPDERYFVRQLTGILGEDSTNLSREINPTVYPVAEFRSKLAEGDHFVSSILKAKKIFLIGDKDDLAGLAEKPLSG